MAIEAQLVGCYNKGCGQEFDPENNDKDECRFHPGEPIFHDAYKGWSCCNKKSTDFTEFLNFKGCTLGKHSNVKPAEPEKKKLDPEDEAPKPVERKPVMEYKARPDYNSPCVLLEPTVNPSFKKQMDSLDTSKLPAAVEDGIVAIGTSCKHGGCSASYDSPASDEAVCVFHPGVPVFHEGYKFWSCCQKKTSDFSTFLSQVGCEQGKHKWIQEGKASVDCRWDWHQTGNQVVVAVYAKNYNYKESFVKINPVRLIVKLIFPQQCNAEFNIDVELRGVVDVSRASVTMYGTKVEITLPKADGGQWLKLDFPREKSEADNQVVSNNAPTAKEDKKTQGEKKEDSKSVDEDDSDVDLDDIELESGVKITELTELARASSLD